MDLMALPANHSVTSVFTSASSCPHLIHSDRSSSRFSVCSLRSRVPHYSFSCQPKLPSRITSSLLNHGSRPGFAAGTARNRARSSRLQHYVPPSPSTSFLKRSNSDRHTDCQTSLLAARCSSSCSSEGESSQLVLQEERVGSLADPSPPANTSSPRPTALVVSTLAAALIFCSPVSALDFPVLDTLHPISLQQNGPLQLDELGPSSTPECEPTSWISEQRGACMQGDLVLSPVSESAPPMGLSSSARLSSTAFSSVTPEERAASEVLARKVSGAVDLLEKGKQAQVERDYKKALKYFSEVTSRYGDLSLAEYARVGRAIMLYEEGSRSDAIIEMEDMSIGLKGYPEVHAALAAALYADKGLVIQAERQFNLATLLDPRYASTDFVTNEKHWPPSLVAALRRFLTLA